MVQTCGGRGPLDPALSSTVLALLGLALLATSALDAFTGGRLLRSGPAQRVGEPR